MEQRDIKAKVRRGEVQRADVRPAEVMIEYYLIFFARSLADARRLSAAVYTNVERSMELQKQPFSDVSNTSLHFLSASNAFRTLSISFIN